MITCVFKGRMCNTMFQVASTIGIAIANNQAYGFPLWEYQTYFKNALPRMEHRQYSKIVEANFHYDKYIIPDGNHELDGYFQSLKYFSHCEGIIRKQFELKDEIQEGIYRRHKKLLSDNNLVSVHVRRGDYLKLADYHYNLPMSYYEKAMKMFDGNYRFIIFSDDVEWCKKQNWNIDKSRLYFGHNNDAIADFCLMTKCNHFIIANSSFSWWSSYLRESKNKIIISPKKWFGEKKLNLNTNDLIPKEWKRI